MLRHLRNNLEKLRNNKFMSFNIDDEKLLKKYKVFGLRLNT